jgi:hypothetical protein
VGAGRGVRATPGSSPGSVAIRTGVIFLGRIIELLGDDFEVYVAKNLVPSA